MLGLLILVAVIGMAYAAYRWNRNRVLAEQLLERKQRHLEQQQTWDRMVADLARDRRAKADAPSRPAGT